MKVITSVLAAICLLMVWSFITGRTALQDIASENTAAMLKLTKHLDGRLGKAVAESRKASEQIQQRCNKNSQQLSEHATELRELRALVATELRTTSAEVLNTAPPEPQVDDSGTTDTIPVTDDDVTAAAFRPSDYPFLSYDSLGPAAQEHFKPYEGKAVYIANPLHEGAGACKVSYRGKAVAPNGDQEQLLMELAAAHFEFRVAKEQVVLSLLESGDYLFFETHRKAAMTRYRKENKGHSRLAIIQNGFALFHDSRFKANPEFSFWKREIARIGHQLLQNFKASGKEANSFGVSWHEVKDDIRQFTGKGN